VAAALYVKLNYDYYHYQVLKRELKLKVDYATEITLDRAGIKR